MNRIAKASLIIVGGFLLNLPSQSFGQSPDKAPMPKEREEEIVIRKKGDKKEKTTIVIDGEKITINGKPMEDYNDKDITIMKMKRPGAVGSTRMRPPARVMGIPGADMDAMQHFGPMMAGNKALLGVTTEKTADGAKVISVAKESAAEKAGLKKDDIITKVDKEAIATPEDLMEAISEHKPSDKVDITYKRNGKEDKVIATLGENKNMSFNFKVDDNNFKFDMPEKVFGPSLEGGMFNWNRKPKIGMQIQDVEEGKGVKVNDVDDDSPASKSGFKEGDVITGINGKPIEGVDDLKTQLKDLKEGDSVKVDFNRGGKTQSAEIKIPKRLKTADL